LKIQELAHKDIGRTKGTLRLLLTAGNFRYRPYTFFEKFQQL